MRFAKRRIGAGIGSQTSKLQGALFDHRQFARRRPRDIGRFHIAPEASRIARLILQFPDAVLSGTERYISKGGVCQPCAA